MESRLYQSQKLESIGELAAGIAHEINTPTQYVMSNLQFLQDSFSFFAKQTQSCLQLQKFVAENTFGEKTTELQRLAEEVVDEEEAQYLNEDIPNALMESESGLKRISEIVQSIKQLAHPGEMTKGYWDLNEIVLDAVNVSTNEWKYHAQIKNELDKSLPKIFCLKAEIGQVVLNMIINAAHAIEVAALKDKRQGVITLQSVREEEYVVLKISDNGTGIPQEIREKIFDPFFTTKEVGKGTGQGLAIAYNVVTSLHSGTIEVASVPGKESTFTVRLPIHEIN